MPKQRLQVDSPVGAAALRPAAAPVDTFVQTSEGKSLEQLAQGLAALSPALGRFSDVLSQRKAEGDYAAGQKKARDLAQSAKDFKDAIKNGSITPNQSPWFMAGLREQFGRLAADRMNFEMLSSMVQDETMQTSTNPADFDKFAQDFTQKWQENNLDPSSRDLHFEKGFGSKADAYLADAQRTFVSQLAGRVTKYAGDGHFSEVINNVMAEWGRHTSPETIGAAITDLNDAAVARGMGGDLVNKMTIDAVISAAKRTNDPEMLHLLDHIWSGKLDYKGRRPALSSITYGAKALYGDENGIGAFAEIGAENQARNSRIHAADELKKQQAVEGLLTNAWQILDKSNGLGDMKVIRDQMMSVAPEKVTMLYQMQDAWNDHTLKDDPLQAASAFRRVYTTNPGENYTTLEDAASMLASKQLSIPTYRQLVNDIQERDKLGPDRFEKDRLFKEGQRQQRAMFVSEFGFEGPAMRQKAEEAVDEFSMRYIRWRLGAGKDATEEQARKWIHDTRVEVFRGKSGATDVRDFEKIPSANLGPQPPNPDKMLVTDPSNLRMLETESAQIGSQKRGGFSSQALSVLKYAGIPPDSAAVQAFLQAQKKFIPTFIPPDSTQH